MHSLRETQDVDRPFVLSVVGPQDSGKTTLIAKLCSHWSRRGFAAAVIKHDGHADTQGRDDWEKPESDTTLYAGAGAVYTMVSGGGQTLLRSVRDPAVHDVNALIERVAQAGRDQGRPLDIVLVEGFKQSRLPKLIPVRRSQDVDWVRTNSQSLANIVGIVSTEECIQGLKLAEDSWPVYHEDDIEKLCNDVWR